MTPSDRPVSLWVSPASPARATPSPRTAPPRGLARPRCRRAVCAVRIPCRRCQALLYARPQRGDAALKCVSRFVELASLI
eukprot:4229024-Lingulodinium_polyedra.AAC.1